MNFLLSLILGMVLPVAMAQTTCFWVPESPVYLGTGVNISAGGPYSGDVLMNVDLFRDEDIIGPQKYCNLGTFSFESLVAGFVYWFFQPNVWSSCTQNWPGEGHKFEIFIYPVDYPSSSCSTNDFVLSAEDVPFFYVSPTPGEIFANNSKFLLQATSSYPLFSSTPMFCAFENTGTGITYPTPVQTWSQLSIGITFPIPSDIVPSSEYQIYCGFTYGSSAQLTYSPMFSIIP